jgi:hypothetical protein
VQSGESQALDGSEAVAKQKHIVRGSIRNCGAGTVFLCIQTSKLDMAFPIPSHLPRRPNPHDVSSNILSKIDDATSHTLNASLASSWLTELEDSIRAIKVGSTHISLFILCLHLYYCRNVYTNVYMLTCPTSIASSRRPSLCRHAFTPCPQMSII